MCVSKRNAVYIAAAHVGAYDSWGIGRDHAHHDHDVDELRSAVVRVGGGRVEVVVRQ